MTIPVQRIIIEAWLEAIDARSGRANIARNRADLGDVTNPDWLRANLAELSDSETITLMVDFTSFGNGETDDLADILTERIAAIDWDALEAQTA